MESGSKFEPKIRFVHRFVDHEPEKDNCNFFFEPTSSLGEPGDIESDVNYLSPEEIILDSAEEDKDWDGVSQLMGRTEVCGRDFYPMFIRVVSETNEDGMVIQRAFNPNDQKFFKQLFLDTLPDDADNKGFETIELPGIPGRWVMSMTSSDLPGDMHPEEVDDILDDEVN